MKRHFHFTMIPAILPILLLLIACRTSDRIPESKAGTQIPSTISHEARDFLKRTKGNIVANYLLDEVGNYILPDIHRKAAPDIHFEKTQINGVPAYWVSGKKASGTDTVVVYLHGGGFVEGGGKVDGAIIFPVFEEMGIRGLSVDYRLAPKHPFPAAVDDTINLFLGLLEKGYRPDQIALTGDSAGATLALAATIALKDQGKPLPGAIAIISPATDLTIVGDTVATLSDSDPFNKIADVRSNAQKYAGHVPRDQPLVSPIYGNYKGFPPLLIQVGTRELLLSDAVRLERKARQAGVEVTLDIWEGMWHSWHMIWPEIPEARQACEEIAKFLEQHLVPSNEAF